MGAPPAAFAKVAVAAAARSANARMIFLAVSIILNIFVLLVRSLARYASVVREKI
jgi:hypothetical protein